MSQNWTWNDYDIVRKNYPLIGDATVDLLEDRTVSALQTKAQRLGVSFKQPLSENECELLSKYGSTLNTALIFLMPNRSVVEIEEALK